MVKDIIFTNDLAVVNGDFAVGASDLQHAEHILVAHPGQYKNAPWVGAAIGDYSNAPISPKVRQELEREIKLQLDADGAKNSSIKLDSELLNIQINVDYD